MWKYDKLNGYGRRIHSWFVEEGIFLGNQLHG
jgi:hypothetical protein